MFNNPILEKINKKLEQFQKDKLKNKGGNQLAVQNTQQKRDKSQSAKLCHYNASQKLNSIQVKKQNDIDQYDQSESSQSAIKPNFEKFEGVHTKVKKQQPINHHLQQEKIGPSLSVLAKKQEGNDTSSSVFDEKFKRNFVLQMVKKVDQSKQEDKLKILRNQAREAGINFFDAKIWVIGYKLIFQIQEELKNHQQTITQQYLKLRIADKIKTFWQQNPKEKRYYLLKLQSVIFRSFEIVEPNPGVWFDTNINENNLKLGFDNFEHVPDSIKQSMAFPIKGVNKKINNTGQYGTMKLKKYQKGPYSGGSNKILNRGSYNSLQGPSFKTSKSTHFPLDFKVRVAEKLDNLFFQFLNATFNQQGHDFCMNKEVLREIYNDFGSLNLEKKKIISCDRGQFKNCLENCELYTPAEVLKISQAVNSCPPSVIQKMLLKSDSSVDQGNIQSQIRFRSKANGFKV